MNNPLNELFSDLLKRFNKVQLSLHSKNTIEEGNAIFQEGVSVLTTLKEYTVKLEGLLSDCQDFIKDAITDLNQNIKPEDFVFHTTNGMLSYNTRSLVIDKNLLVNTYKLKEPKPVEEKKTTTNIEKVFIKEMNTHFNVPVVKSLDAITPMFYYFAGNANNAAGVYCCLVNNIYIRVPFPEVIDSTRDYNKIRSIRCKYKTKACCDEQRSRMAKFHASDIRQCNFAHQGEPLVKIGYPSRCSLIPSFGNPETFLNDYKLIDKKSLETIMMYGLSDLIAVALTIDNMKYNINKHVFDNLY